MQLNESGEKDAYTFNGTSVTETGAEVKYSGRITPKAMQLSLEVTMAHYGSVANTYVFPAYSHTTTEEVTVRNSGASYVNITVKEESESIKPIILQIKQMATKSCKFLENFFRRTFPLYIERFNVREKWACYCQLYYQFHKL